jgi:hypothetical protein
MSGGGVFAEGKVLVVTNIPFCCTTRRIREKFGDPQFQRAREPLENLPEGLLERIGTRPIPHEARPDLAETPAELLR